MSKRKDLSHFGSMISEENLDEFTTPEEASVANQERLDHILMDFKKAEKRAEPTNFMRAETQANLARMDSAQKK